jgi:hypothetical protein
VIIILGLIILVAAVIVGVAGVLSNGGNAHALGNGFTVLGYHVTGSSGTLFLSGIVVGAAGLLGLGLLLAGARRASRRGREARGRLQQSRRETAAASKDRDQLIDQRDAARADVESKHAEGTPRGDRDPSPRDSNPNRPHLLGRWTTPRHAADATAESPNGQAAPDVLADSVASD